MALKLLACEVHQLDELRIGHDPRICDARRYIGARRILDE